MNNYQAAAQAGFPPASPHGAGGHGGPQGRSFPAANSPGPIDMYSSSAAAAAAAAAADSAVASYVQAAASPQPPTTAFPAIAVSRAPLNYNPVSLSPAHSRGTGNYFLRLGGGPYPARSRNLQKTSIQNSLC